MVSSRPPLKSRTWRSITTKARRPVIVVIVAVVILVGIGGAAAAWFRRTSEPAASQSAASSTHQAGRQKNDGTKSARIRLIASGDMLAHDSINAQAKRSDGSYDYRPFFSEVEPFFQKADIRFCNQEVVTAGQALGISGYPTFNAPTEFAKDLSKVGCNLISLANNHLNDKGQAGIDKTLSVWDELKPLAVAGANRTSEEQAKVRYFTVQDVKFAFVAYAEYSNNRNYTAHGVNILNDGLVRSQLTEARSKADIVLVSAHWGTEYSPRPNAFQEQWAAKFAEYGADVVIGTGPHVLQPFKKLPRAGGGETYVWYSLGNLLSTQLDVESLIGGLAVMDIDPASKKLLQPSFLPTYMHYEWTPQEKAREDLLARKNLKLYPLDLAAEPLKRSQNNTTVETQTRRVTELLNSMAEVKILKSSEY